ncbi:MAG: hypothetical protein EPO11_01695, partial [Gammaproteobacteria bacterium]
MKFYRHWSLTAKLTFLYTLSVSALFLIATFLWSYSLVGGLLQIGTNFGIEEILLVQNIMKAHPDNPVMLKQEVTWVLTRWDSQDSAYYIRILDHDQHLVMETPGMNSELHKQLFP